MKADEVYAKLKKMLASVSVGINNTTSKQNPDGSVTIMINFVSGSPLSFTMSPVKGDKGTGIKDAIIKEIQNGENTEYHLILIDDKNNNIDAGKLPASSREEYDYTQIKSDINDLKSDKQDKTDNSLETTDKTLVGAINTINGNQLDTVTFSADYKNIILNRKNGLNPYTIPISSIIRNAKITEFNDVDSTNIADGKILVYNDATKKHKYVGATLTDELVKMNSTTDAKHLSELIDKQTIVNDNGVLKVKKLDGQEVTITEINHLKGLTMNIVDLVKSFSNGGVKMYEHTIPTYADLLALDRSSFIDGIRYFVYVLADETHGGIKTTYICDKKKTDYFGVAGDDRDFTAEPIDLANEVTGKLGATNIDTDALWKLLTISNAYSTLTNKNEPFGTHGAKALYDELVEDIGLKANSTDLTTHTSDTNTHITSNERTKWNEVDNKVNKTDITTTINSSSTDSQVPSANYIYNKFIIDNIKDICVNTTKGNKSLSKYGVDDISKLTGLLSLTSKLNPITNTRYTIQIIESIKQTFYDCGLIPVPESGLLVITTQNMIGKAIFTTDSGLIYVTTTSASKNNEWTPWQKVCTTTVADVGTTQIKFTYNTNYEVVNDNCNYIIKNGICTMFLYVKCKTPSNAWKTVSKVPKTSNLNMCSAISSLNGDGFLRCSINTSGGLNFANGIAGTSYLGTIIYQVAEQ